MNAIDSLEQCRATIESWFELPGATQYSTLKSLFLLCLERAYPYWVRIANQNDNPTCHHLVVAFAAFRAGVTAGDQPDMVLQAVLAALLHDIIDKAGKTTSGQVKDERHEELRRLHRFAHMFDSAAEAIRILQELHESNPSFLVLNIQPIALAISKHDYPSARVRVDCRGPDAKLLLGLILSDQLWLTAFPQSQGMIVGPLADLWRNGTPLEPACILKQLKDCVSNTRKRLSYLDVDWEKGGMVFPTNRFEAVFQDQITAWAGELRVNRADILEN